VDEMRMGGKYPFNFPIFYVSFNSEWGEKMMGLAGQERDLASTGQLTRQICPKCMAKN